MSDSATIVISFVDEPTHETLHEMDQLLLQHGFNYCGQSGGGLFNIDYDYHGLKINVQPVMDAIRLWLRAQHSDLEAEVYED